MKRGVSLAGVCSLLLITAAICLAPSNASAQNRRRMISDRADENNRVTLQGNTRNEANSQNDRERVPDSMRLDHLMLLMQRSPESEAALGTYIDELHDKHSANFHKWLTPTQFGQTYGPSAEDIEAVTAWLKSNGFEVNMVYPSGMLIDFSGTAGQVRQALRTEIHNLNVNGVAHISNMSDPSIPAAFAAAVKGVLSLNDFKPHPMMKHVHSNFTFGPNCGFLTGLRDATTNCEALMPQDLATIYNLNPLFSAGITGKGQTIVVVEDEDAFSLSDWSAFRKVGGLARTFPFGTVSQTHPASSPVNNCVDPGDLNDSTDDEVAIDMEWASAAAPNAAIQVAVCDDTRTNFGGLIALVNILNAPNASTTGPAVVSISYGESESQSGATLNAAFNAAYQQGVAEGVSIFVSSGDEGAASSNANGADSTRGITVSGWTSTPYNISVGGTDFEDSFLGQESTYWNPTNTAAFGSARSYIPEIPWNDSCADSQIINFLGTYFSSALVNGYGPSGTGVCNTYPFNVTSALLTTGSGSGGPSNCAVGSPTTSGAPASGGTCHGYAKPSWQNVVGNPSDGVRDIPDVSLMAANGVWNHFYPVCESNTAPIEVENGLSASCTLPPNDWPGFGGTSVSSPILAGIQALVNQKTGQRWGNANTVYYAIARGEYGSTGNPSCNSRLGNTVGASCTFYDVQEGSIYLPCATNGNGANARLYNCYRPSTTDSATDIGVMSAAPETFPGLAGPGPVTALNVTQSGGGTTDYASAPTCAITGDAGAGATCTASISGLVTALTVTSQGTGYVAGDALGCFLVGGPNNATCSGTVNGAGAVVLTLRSGGSGYTSAPTCILVGGSGTGATCSATEHVGVTGISLTAGGSGYTSDPTCSLSGGGGVPNAVCTSIINGVQTLAPQAYPATVGWDFATGIGTVNAYNLVMNSAWLP
jgi:subtilase family serine protease